MTWVLLISGLLLLAGCITVYVYRRCFHSPADRVEDPYTLIKGAQYKALADVILECTRVMDRTPCEHLFINSHDGLKLHARYYHLSDNAPTAIVMHGYRSFALRDAAGGFALCRRLGFNVLVPDQRSHARSEGRVITFGVKERLDCLRWIEYVNEHAGNRPILLSGLSMGATSVLMASELDLPENVVGIMADCPYSSPAGIIRKVSTDWGYPAWLVNPFARLAAKLLGGFTLTECSAAEAVKHATIPILLIHGDDDRFVPCQMSMEIAENCASPVRLELFPGAGHGLSYMIDPERYEAVAVEFMHSIPALRPYLPQGNL